MHCTSCDTRNPADARFCVSCGAQLELPPSSVPPTPRQRPGYAPTPSSQQATYVPPGAIQQPGMALQPGQPANATLLVQQAQAPGCLVRGVYFILVGWWLGLLVTAFAWALMLTLVAAPLGVMLLNRLPQFMTLQPAAKQLIIMSHNGGMIAYDAGLAQRPLVPRIVYFVLFGWWLSAIWLSLAWAIIPGSLGLGLPIAFWMFNQAPAVVSLRR